MRTMNAIASPQPVDLAQRIAVRLLRGATRSLAALSRLRPRSAALAVELRRYGSRSAETLEWIHPPPGVTPLAPVVYLHGGGWICGLKELYTSELAFLALRGHPVLNLDYPLAPEHPHPLPLISLLHGLAWIRRGAPEASAVHLMGDSAGGNLALMLGLLLENPRLLSDLDPSLLGLALPRPLSVISLYGVLDRQSWLRTGFPGSRLMLACYGGPGAFADEVGPKLAITPLDLDCERTPPCFLAVGTRDRLAESSRLAAQRLSGAGARVRFETYEGEIHGFFNQSWRPQSARLRRDITDFLCEFDLAAAEGRSEGSPP